MPKTKWWVPRLTRSLRRSKFTLPSTSKLLIRQLPIITALSRVTITGLRDGEDQTFETVAAAPAVSESVSEVHSESALVSAKINPGGKETTYHFEYGTVVCSANPGSCTSVPMPEMAIGSGTTAQSVSELLTGLTPGTIYNVRVRCNEHTRHGKL